jgi:hypothetical protein
VVVAPQSQGASAREENESVAAADEKEFFDAWDEMR